jgi:hypothetical protein
MYSRHHTFSKVHVAYSQFYKRVNSMQHQITNTQLELWNNLSTYQRSAVVTGMIAFVPALLWVRFTYVKVCQVWRDYSRVFTVFSGVISVPKSVRVAG